MKLIQKANKQLRVDDARAEDYLKAGYYAIVLGSILWGVFSLATQNRFCKYKTLISVLLTAAGTLLFIISRQPTGATLLLVFLAVKVLMTRKVSSL